MANTTDIILFEEPGLTVEHWADQMFLDLWEVPPLSWQASLFIHRRVLSIYQRPPASEARHALTLLSFTAFFFSGFALLFLARLSA